MVQGCVFKGEFGSHAKPSWVWSSGGSRRAAAAPLVRLCTTLCEVDVAAATKLPPHPRCPQCIRCCWCLSAASMHRAPLSARRPRRPRVGTCFACALHVNMWCAKHRCRASRRSTGSFGCPLASDCAERRAVHARRASPSRSTAWRCMSGAHRHHHSTLAMVKCAMLAHIVTDVARTVGEDDHARGHHTIILYCLCRLF